MHFLQELVQRQCLTLWMGICKQAPLAIGMHHQGPRAEDKLSVLFEVSPMLLRDCPSLNVPGATGAMLADSGCLFGPGFSLAVSAVPRALTLWGNLLPSML